MQGDADFRFSPRPNRAAEIEWRPWGEPAFAEACRLRRPILLSLSAVWCHWCHVMDETSYSDSRVITRINEVFVPIRADNDRNPDVNRRYNMGGWPTTAFLAANGDIISGATYLPPGQMLQALERIVEFFEANRTALLALETAEHAHAADAEAALAHLGGAPRLPADGEDGGEPGLPGDVPAGIALEIIRAFDPLHGGLGTEQKFPQADAFAYLLAFSALRREDDTALPGRIRKIERTTLTNMATGDLYDGVAGGFFRYSTKRDWSEPHYEKMLEDNARLATLYLDASEIAAGDDGSDLGSASFYHDVAEGVIDYLLATLLRADVPCLGGSQDADEAYYRLDAGERAKRTEPFVDQTVYVDWNALTAHAFLRAASLLRRPELLERALELLEYLWVYARRDGAMAHYLVAADDTPANGSTRPTQEGPEEDPTVALVPGPGAPLLADQAAVSAALLDAYEVTGERVWLERALELAGWAVERLRAPDGRLLDRLSLPGQSAGLLAHPVPALEENAAMAECFLRLAAYTEDQLFRGHALDVLAAWAPQYEKYGLAAGSYGSALLRYLERPDHLIVLGGRADPATRRLHAAALTTPQPLRTVQLLDPADPTDAERIARADLGDAGAPAVYVCRGTACFAPITSAAVLEHRLD